MSKQLNNSIIDIRDKKIRLVISTKAITVFKDEIYLCTLLWSNNFKCHLAGFFNEHAGFTSGTLKDISQVLAMLDGARNEKISAIKEGNNL